MNKYVVITGASSGIGLECAKLLYDNGYTPLLIGRSSDKLSQVSKELDNSPFLSCDLSKSDSVLELMTFYKSLKDGEVLAVINNAGAIKYNAFEETSSEEWAFHFSANVMTAINTTKAFLNDLKKTKGSIVNISSTLALKPIENTSAYSASKAAMNSLTKSMALELSNFGIRVNALCPGIVNTPIHSDSQSKIENWAESLKEAQPLGRVGEPLDIANAIKYLISKDNGWMTGSLIPLDGGIMLKG